MNNKNAVERFRVDLSVIVRRLSREPIHVVAIDEMVSHFDGILQEVNLGEPNEAAAEKKARKRMGSLYKISFQIVNTPDRVRRGIRLQILSSALLFGIIVAYDYATTRTSVTFTSAYLPAIAMLLQDVIFVLCGICAGIGISFARRLVWKPLAFAVFAAFLVGGQIINASVPEIHMPEKQMTDIASLQSSLEPKVATIEGQVKGILSQQNWSREEWKSESSKLSGLVKAGNVDYYKEVSGSSGPYLYPSKLDYPHDYTINYSVKLCRTNDLEVAKRAWRNDASPGVLLPMEFQVREDNFKAWKTMAANYSNLWMRGFQLNGIGCLVSLALYLLLALGGLLLGRARAFGPELLRSARA